MSGTKYFTNQILVETLFKNDNLIKNGQALSSIKDSIVSYFNAHNDPEDPTGTLLNFLAPGAITMAIGGPFGILVGVMMRVFDIDVASILRSAYESIKSLLSSGNKITSDQLDQIAQSSVEKHTNEQLGTVAAKDILWIKNAMKIHETQAMQDNELKVFAAGFGKNKGAAVFAKVLGFILKTAVASAGLMVAGDAVNKMVGRPNAFDGTLQHGKPTTPTKITPIISTQTKFPVRTGFSDIKFNQGSNWSEKIQNNKYNIENMLVNFTKDVYDGLNGKENIIKSSPAFKATVDMISWYNHTGEGDNIIYIPKSFTSKKQLVDHFIDSVAKQA